MSKLVAYTDEQIDELVKTTPSTVTKWEDIQNWTLGEFLVNKPFSSPHYGAKCFQDYTRLITTCSNDALKKLILFNPGIAKSEFDRICYKPNKAYQDLGYVDHNSLIEWIIESQGLDVNYMLPILARNKNVQQLMKILHDLSIKQGTLTQCFTNLCCYMYRASQDTVFNATQMGIEWNKLVEQDRQLFDLFFNDSRIDVTQHDNDAFALAILHNNDYAINKLLNHPNIKNCKNWESVLEASIYNVEIFKQVLEWMSDGSKFSRRIMNKLKDNQEFEFIKTHPIYLNSLDVFQLKTVEQLLEQAAGLLRKYRDDDVAQILAIAKRRVNNEPEDPDEHYDDEKYAYVVDEPLRWWERNN